MDFLKYSKKTKVQVQGIVNFIQILDELCQDMVKAMYVDSQKKNPQNFSIKP